MMLIWQLATTVTASLVGVALCSEAITTFQCPEGHYLSSFNTAFVATQRYYKFACTAFSNIHAYTVGVEIIEDSSRGTSRWQLLCCSSASAKIRIRDCIDTKFLNEHRRSCTFSTGTQIIRRWQAFLDNALVSFRKKLKADESELKQNE
ncbi:unnamed protein product [Gongylonema pulchrum]|uniref:Secreted protein n=1 Tax=Gongylonema pulchrum TaxID=637853 RepID=A0A183EF41_9BILA|nr:unnamed protein product [Gongylonema pulchrum]